MDADILSQLTQLKWLLASLVGLMLLIAAIRVLDLIRKAGGVDRIIPDDFAGRAHALLNDSRYSELLELARMRIDERPGDVYAYWYHAMAAYRLGDIDTSLRSMRKTGELQPDWRESHVDPFIQALTAVVQARP